MQQASGSHSNPKLQCAVADLKRLLQMGRTPDSFGRAPSRSMHISKRREKIQHALRKWLDILEDEVLPQEYDALTYKPEPDVEYIPLPRWK